MQDLSESAKRTVHDLAARHGVSGDAVKALLVAVAAGGGTMAQFQHSELGGSGQWMRGGMTMVGDFGNGALRGKVDALCTALSELLAKGAVFVASSGAPAQPATPHTGFAPTSWWPRELGVPTTAGGQNDTQYAYFPAVHRLAVRQGGGVTIYDTLDHAISGVQQQQGGGGPGSVVFSSQHGTFSVEHLRPVTPTAVSPSSAPQASSPSPPLAQKEPVALSGPSSAPREHGRAHGSSDDVLGAIERLGALRERGIITESEFQAKKGELLSRL